MPVQQAIEDANPCRLADRGRNPGHGDLGIRLNTHTLILNELSMSGHPHTGRDGDEYKRAFQPADGPPSSHFTHAEPGCGPHLAAWPFRRPTKYREDRNENHLLHSLPD